MTSEHEKGNQGAGEQSLEARFAGGRLRKNIEVIRAEVGDDKELIRQAISEFFALDRQNLRNHFEGRLEYSRQVNEHRHATLRGLVEYGLQTLKWSFLLNAGAIAVLMAYVGGSVGKSTDPAAIKTYAPLIKDIWPFVVGCVLVTMAGAAAFFNFSHSETALPSSELLHNFLAPDAKAWPIARFQRIDETQDDFIKRVGWKVNAWRNAAIFLAVGSAVFFAIGAFLVMRSALT